MEGHIRTSCTSFVYSTKHGIEREGGECSAADEIVGLYWVTSVKRIFQKGFRRRAS